MSPPALTVAIPCRDAGPFLRPLLESLLRQTLADFRLLLVDDGSSDDSGAIAHAVAGDRIRIVRNATALGIGANWNRCAELAADSDYFCLAHQDDVYHSTFLERLTDALTERPDAGIAHCRANAIDGDGRPLDSGAERYKQHFWRRIPAPDRASHYQRLWRGNFLCCPAVLYRTAAWRAAGEFRTDLRFALDWEYWFRLLRCGYDIVDVDAALLDYRRHDTAATAAATSDRWRFAEELAVLDEARSAGLAAGLLPADTGPSPALRNNLLHEALTDLERGDRDGAARKLEFVRDHAPNLWNDRYVRTFRALIRCGAPGRMLLGACRGLAIRFGLGGATG
ncbi:MAG: glycosyltransferase [Planctomycetes bacterium]|nr:glycosyltransferase [Planctomycetota bacterium]